MTLHEQPAETMHYQSPPAARTLNWLGVISVVIAAFVALLEFLTILFAGIRANNATRAGTSLPESESMIIGFVALGGLALAFLGIALAFGSLFIPNRGRISSSVGILINGLVILGVILVIIVGLVVA